MIECGICGRPFRDKRGLSSHVRVAHDLPWGDYQKQYPVMELPENEIGAEYEANPPNEAEEDMSVINERLERVEAVVERFMSGTAPSGRPSGVTDFPAEDVEVVGEKLNYKLALNPAIFSRYDRFKAIVKKRGKTWTGDFSDYIEMCTKDLFTIFGIHEMVVEMPTGTYLLST